MRVKVNVERCHIEAGIPDRSSHCPLGLAISKALNDNKMFDEYDPYLNNDGEVYMQDERGCIGMTMELPRSARRFETRVVKGLPVKPFSFYLEF